MTTKHIRVPLEGSAHLIDATIYSVQLTKKSFAVISHPYGPLGGSRQDHVVCSVAEQLQANNIPCITFDFRRPVSWTGQQECDDYIQIVVYAVKQLFRAATTVYCIGYSYGSLMLPSTEDLQKTLSRSTNNQKTEMESLELKMMYVVISPLLAPISSLLTLFGKNKYSHVKQGKHLAIWGSKDDFTSGKRLQNSWPAGVEVSEADHFWRSSYGMNVLLQNILNFVNSR